ncbi:MAG: DUF4405 domain-containing protein [Ruminococcus sp.]|nr:DUF4405 domain-containing protein [Ruminococcus sp.]
MKPVKIIVDCIMIILLPLLMSYALIGEDVHEYLGIAMFAVFIVHHILNRSWFKTVFKGRYTPYRIYSNTINILLCIIMIALPVSGILMSKHAVPFLSITSGASLARTVHMTTSYWGFVLMSLHLGNHASVMMNGMRKMFHITGKSAIRTTVLRVIAALICGYGIYAFIKRDLLNYLFMQVMFAFFDLNENKALFFLDYIAMILMLAIVSYYIGKMLRKSSGKDKAGS